MTDTILKKKLLLIYFKANENKMKAKSEHILFMKT